MLEEPKAEAILAEMNGFDAEGSPLASYEQLNDDGSTACGCCIHCGSYADGVNRFSTGRSRSSVEPGAPGGKPAYGLGE